MKIRKSVLLEKYSLAWTGSGRTQIEQSLVETRKISARACIDLFCEILDGAPDLN